MSTAEQVRTPRHVKVTGVLPAFGYEPCEDVGCTVGHNGVASSCGRVACPVCGYGGTNLIELQLVDAAMGAHLRCACGHTWLHGERPLYVVMRAETVERERDHPGG
jgi:hypothetical protein